jgi:hypothetical protein
MYARVENNQIVGVMFNLPTTHANISGFDKLPAADLITYGYYPLEEVKPELAFEIHDDGEVDDEGNPVLRKVFTQAYGESTDSVKASKVVRTYAVIDLPADEVKAEKNRPTVKKIAAAESSALMPRAMREFMLEQPGAANKPWFAKVKALDDEVAALRSKLIT